MSIFIDETDKVADNRTRRLSHINVYYNRRHSTLAVSFLSPLSCKQICETILTVPIPLKFPAGCLTDALLPVIIGLEIDCCHAPCFNAFPAAGGIRSLSGSSVATGLNASVSVPPRN